MVKIPGEVDLEDLVTELCDQMDREELLDLVKMIDQDVADYDFTYELKEYFTEEVRREEEFLDEE